MRRRAIIAAVALLVTVPAVTTCSENPVLVDLASVSEPIAVIRLSNRGGGLLAVGTESRRVLRHAKGILDNIRSVRLSPDGSRVVVMGAGPAGWTEYQIVTLDSRTQEEISREFLASESGYRLDRFDGMEINAAEFAFSPSGDELFIGSAARPAEGFGIAVLDARTFDPLGFLGPYPDHKVVLATIPPGVLENGAVVFSTPEGDWPPVGPRLRFIDPVTLSVTDSVNLAPWLQGAEDGIFQIAAGPDGRALFLQAASGLLLKYDLASRDVTARAYRPGPGHLTVSSDGERIFLPRHWTRDAPSPGIVDVYDSDLEGLEPIDLSDVRVPPWSGDGLSAPPALNRVGMTPDGTIILTSGTSPFSSLWGGQGGRIFFVEPETSDLLETINLDDIANELTRPRNILFTFADPR